MRRTILLSIPSLALLACETAIEPLAPDGTVRQSVEFTESSSYGATVLPDGVLSSRAHLVVDDEGHVYGSIVHESGTDRAAKWTQGENGNMTGPEFLGTLPAPFDRADQYVEFTSREGGLVLGYASTSRTRVGWLWTEATGMILLPAVDGGRAFPKAANDEGVIVGEIRFDEKGGAGTSPVVWMPPYDAEPTILPRTEGYWLNSPRGITNDGLVTGWLRGSGMADVLVQWRIDDEGNALSGPDMIEGIEGILMLAVNQDRDVVGVFHRDGGWEQWEPYLFRSAEQEAIDLGSLQDFPAGSAQGVSNRGEDGGVRAVGGNWTRIVDEGRAVLWSVNAGGTVAGPIDLGVPPATVVRERPLRTAEFVSAGASAINSEGLVVGWSRRADRTFFATLWRPNQKGGDEGRDDDCKRHPKTGECR